MIDNFMPGDIGLSTGDAFISRAIKFFTSWQTGNATKSHAFGSVGGRLIVEALGKIRVNSIEKYEDSVFDVYRLPLNEADRDSFELNMLREVQSGYGWFKLPLFALDGVTTAISRIFGRVDPVFFFTRYFGVTSFRVCSQYVVWGLHKFTAYRLKNSNNEVVHWRTVSPDYLEDLLKLPINGAILIHSNKPVKPTGAQLCVC